MDTALIRREGNIKTGEYFLRAAVFFLAANRKNKIDRKWIAPGIINGRFGNKYALVHFRWSYFEGDLEDMRPASSFLTSLDAVGR